LKPIITVYSGGTSNQTKKLEGYIAAAFWMGVDHAENELDSVKVRQPTESYDAEVANLTEFTSLLVERQINFSVEFFSEPSAQESQAEEESQSPEIRVIPEGRLATAGDYQKSLEELKDEYTKGSLTKKQYESKRNVILKQWKEKVEGTLGM
jgi:hypothetical protein